jgi:hypothetical protein
MQATESSVDDGGALLREWRAGARRLAGASRRSPV